MEKLALLPYPKFLSPQIQAYITEIAAPVNRRVVFGDLSDQYAISGMQAEAAMMSAPDLPVVILYVRADMSKSYDSYLDDAVLAHEITHLQLQAQGWQRIVPVEGLTSDLRNKITYVQNWLTDPVINARIQKRGFDMAANRKKAVDETIQQYIALEHIRRHALTLGTIQSKNFQTGEIEMISVQNVFGERASMHDLSIFITYCLESLIGEGVKQRLETAFKQTFPEFTDLASRFLSIIAANGFDTADKYAFTARMCLNELQIDEGSYSFRPLVLNTGIDAQEWLQWNAILVRGWK